MPPRVSIIMPAHNTAPFVGKAVESVLRQTFTDFELIVIDDASTDGTTSILEGYAARDPRIRILRNDRVLGVGAATRMGFAAARSEWVARADSDDLVHPEWLAKATAFLASNPDVVLVSTCGHLIDEDGQPFGPPIRLPLDNDVIVRSLFAGDWPIINQGLLARREQVLLAAPGMERYTIAEDHYLFMRLAELGRLANLPEDLVAYRKRRGSLTATNRGAIAARLKIEIICDAIARRGSCPATIRDLLPSPFGWQPVQPRMRVPLCYRVLHRRWGPAVAAALTLPFAVAVVAVWLVRKSVARLPAPARGATWSRQ